MTDRLWGKKSIVLGGSYALGGLENPLASTWIWWKYFFVFGPELRLIKVCSPAISFDVLSWEIITGVVMSKDLEWITFWLVPLSASVLLLVSSGMILLLLVGDHRSMKEWGCCSPWLVDETSLFSVVIESSRKRRKSVWRRRKVCRKS